MKRDPIAITIDVVADILGLQPSEVTSNADLSELGADQRDLMDIVTELEDRLRIELPTNLEDAQTVADLAAGLERALFERAIV